jgi:GAF domain-containing protein
MRDAVVGTYAAGVHAPMIRNLCMSPGDGIVGWIAAHRRAAVNAEPALDFGVRATELDPPLLSTLAVPLMHDGALVAVLAVYTTTRGAFSEDHARVLDVLAPQLAKSLALVQTATPGSQVRAAATRRPALGDLRLLRGGRSAG